MIALEAVIDQITEIAHELNYELQFSNDSLHIVLTRYGTPFSVHLDLHSGESTNVYVLVHTTSWDFPGDRTDLHESVSILLAFYLRTVPPFISSLIYTVRDTVTRATEVDRCFLIIKQPFSSLLLFDKDGLTKVHELLSALCVLELLARQVSGWDAQAQPDATIDIARPWAGEVAQAIGEPLDDAVQFVARTNPSWLHYRSIRTGITVWKSRPMAESLRALADYSADKWETMTGINNRLYVGRETFNAVSYKVEGMLRRLVSQLDEFVTKDGIRLVPIENYLVASGSEVVIAARRNCDRKRFEAQRERIRARHEREAQLLFRQTAGSVPNFVWQDAIDDEQFELLILTLLRREPGVVRARKVSASNEPDSGRDLLCEWNTLPLPLHDIVGDGFPKSARRVVVQCKAYKAPVNKSNVRDIRDTVEHFGADGYFLAVASSLTGGLFDHLDRLRQEGKIWVDWWTRSEIEERLRKHIDVARMFSRVVTVTAPTRTGSDTLS